MSHIFLTDMLKLSFGRALRHCDVDMAFLKANQESRRKFLRNTVKAGAGLLLLPSFLTDANFNNDKNIIIIGAGIAGLNAAYQLQKLGIKSTIYEAANRTGGRMYTMQNVFGENITTDIGGEFVNTTHKDIIELIKEFELDMFDLSKDNLRNKTIFFNNSTYSEIELGTSLQPFVKQILDDIISLPEIKNYTTAAAIEKFDRQSVAGYIKSLGIDGWLYNFIYTVFTSEFGIEANELSAINFLTMFVAPLESETKYQLFGHEHEVMKIKGGSQQLTNALTMHLNKSIQLEHELTGIKNQNNQTALSFLNKGKEVQVVADYVLLTLAFTKLRSISFDVLMPAEKRKCIDELGYGNSSKFIMGFKEKPWRNTHNQGYTFTDEVFGTGWDSSQMQSDTTASFTVFGGGNYSIAINNKKEQELSKDYIAALDKIYPGSIAANTGKNLKFCWQGSSVSKAGYSCYKVGQYSTIAGWEAANIGNIFFAGEHTSSNFQGYMNGAAETGRKAAEQIAANIIKTKII